MRRKHSIAPWLALTSALLLSVPPALAQDAVLFRDVRVFDGVGPALSEPTRVLVRGNRIEAIGPALEAADARAIDGRGRTLMPGLIDVHVHMTFSAMDMATLQSPELTPELAGRAAAEGAEKMLLRGVTSVRDMGGPIFPLKAAIDAGAVKGPRIWPSGAHLSQTSGHGDLRAPHEGPRRFTGKLSRAEQLGATWIADGRDEVLTATRENLRFGASQIKIMAGVKLAWGTDILFDPVVNEQQTGFLLKLEPWFTPAEILKLATHDNAQLLALSGPRSPYQGELGVVREGALADLILVDGDPLANLALVADPAANFDVIMKDGKIVKEQE